MDALLVSLLLTASPGPTCDTFEALHAMLEDAGGVRVFAGIDDQSTAVIEVYTDPVTHQWAVIINGIERSCIASEGRNGTITLPPVPGETS